MTRPGIEPATSRSQSGRSTTEPLCRFVVILCRLPEKGGKEIVEEMKERDREESGTGMKVKKQKK